MNRCEKHGITSNWGGCTLCEGEVSGFGYAGDRIYPPGITASPGPSHGTTLVPNAGGGLKLDQDKPDMSLLSPIALERITEVLNFGKKKYAAHNWRKGIVYSRLLAALLRHVFSYLKGEDKDPESGLSHLAHAGCCVMFLLEFETTRKDLDDRYKPEAS